MAEVEKRLLIGGDLAPGSGPPLEVENPATEEAFQETKHVHIETEIAPKAWWYPYSEYSPARDGALDEGASR